MSGIPTHPQKEFLARGGIKSRLRHDTPCAGQEPFFDGPGAAVDGGGSAIRLGRVRAAGAWQDNLLAGTRLVNVARDPVGTVGRENSWPNCTRSSFTVSRFVLTVNTDRWRIMPAVPLNWETGRPFSALLSLALGWRRIASARIVSAMCKVCWRLVGGKNLDSVSQVFWGVSVE